MSQQQTSPTQQTLEQSPVDYSIQHHSGCIAELSVVASKELSAQARKNAIRQVGKDKVLPGFRKGKAPEELILKNHAQEIEKAWQEQLANLSLKECLKTSSAVPLNQETRISFNVEQFGIGEGAKLSLKFEVEPKIPDVDLEALTINPIERPAVNEEKIEETIRQALFFFAEWKEIEDRAAQEGDCVVLDVDVIETEPTKSLFRSTRFEVTKKGMADWMRNLVVGMKKEESREGESVADPDATAEEKDIFKPKKVRITLRSIQQATLPELTDDFAKNLGVSTVAELRENITNILNKQADEHVREKEREQISNLLVEKYPFDLPLTLVDREARFRMRQLFQDPNFQSYWQTLSEEERKKSIDTLFEQSKKAIRMFYICRKLLVDQKISVSPQELHKAPTSPIEVLINPSAHQHQGTDIENAEAFSRLILEKAEDFLIAKAKEKAAK